MKKIEPYIEESARAFGIDPTTLEPLVGNSGADVFRGDTSTGPRVLKIHSPGSGISFGGKESVIEGLHYQEGLAKRMTGDVAFAGPMRSRSGELGEEIDTDDGPRIAMAFEFAPGKEVYHRVDGYQIPFDDPEVGGPLFERMGKAAGIMHRYSSEYPIWWSAADTDHTSTPFSDRKDRDGAGSSNSIYQWISSARARIVPELQEHWESVSTALDDMTAERDEYGFFHLDYATSNTMYDYECLTVIDHSAQFGQFVYDIGSPFLNLDEAGVEKEHRREYWLRFVSGYRREFALKEKWIPWLRTTLDFRRLAIYFMNVQRQSDGRPSADFQMLPQWREDMMAGKPWVDIDFSLP
jgi:Ser/Thr protein kinase RdoA (MazF antagonist)